MKFPLQFAMTGHLHFKVALAGAEAHADLEILDSDGDGDPEVILKWNLPGQALDSGPEGISVEVPIGTLYGTAAELLVYVLTAAGAPDFIGAAVKKMMIGSS